LLDLTVQVKYIKAHKTKKEEGMKKILFVLLVAALALPSVVLAQKCEEPGKVTLKPGMKVVAQWQGDSWWLAKIDNISKGRYNVTYSDNTKGKNKGKDQIAYYIYENTSKPPCFKEGDKVIAQWKGDNWWKATITSIKGDKANITYSDGEKGTRKLTEMVRDPW
jgi:hypothetical protein